MSDEKALLAAIWDEPHDDTPRLVYADWLDENGDAARAEFVRAQVERARLEDDEPTRPGAEDLESWGFGAVECPHPSPRHAELLRREATLRKANATAWKATAPPKLRAAPYHRGFLAPKMQVISSRKFLSFKPADLASSPLWDFALGYNKTDFPKAVAGTNFLRVGRLEMRADTVPPPNAFRPLIDSPNARNVARLRPMSLGDAGLLALAESPNLPHLTCLQLAYQDLTPAGLAKALAARGKPARPLRELYLRHNQLDDASVSAIVRSPWCAGLRALSLEQNSGITDAGVEELAASKLMKGLRYLSLSYAGRFTDRAAVALAGSPNCANLRILFLNRAGFGEKGGAALAESPHLSRLEFFAMFDTKVKRTSPAGKALVKRFGENVRF